MSKPSSAIVFAGIAGKNPSLYRRVGVPLGDPASWVRSAEETIAIVRDLEMDRVRQHSESDRVGCPADFPPSQGLDADRETATAQATAEYCRRQGITHVTVDRSLPYVFAYHLQQAGIEIGYDAEQGVLDRRQKTERELQLLSEAQAVTETVMRMICETISGCTVDAEGQLLFDGAVLTSERVRSMAAIEFLRYGYSMSHGAIVATAPQVADCHHSGSGPLRTQVPIVVDLFPMNEQTRYWGDCTRTVVHGQPSETVLKMHAAVVRAKQAATERLRVGQTGASVHEAAEQSLVADGFRVARGTLTDEPSIQHGTGHGIGLEVHEPILLDHGGGQLLEREVFTVEPGLYGRNHGGVRIEDMLVVRDGQPQNLNSLHEGLTWK